MCERHPSVAPCVPPTMHLARNPGMCPWPGIKPVTLQLAGWHSFHWATPARAQLLPLKSFVFGQFTQAICTSAFPSVEWETLCKVATLGLLGRISERLYTMFLPRPCYIVSSDCLLADPIVGTIIIILALLNTKGLTLWFEKCCYYEKTNEKGKT